MKKTINTRAVAILTLSIANICYAADPKMPLIKVPTSAPRVAPMIPPPDAKVAEVPKGYQVEVLLSGLQYPSSIEFSDTSIFVAEAGNIDGDWLAPTRVLEFPLENPVGKAGKIVADQLSDDALYIVDIGAVTFTQSGVGPAPRAFPGSGVVWRITHEGK